MPYESSSEDESEKQDKQDSPKAVTNAVYSQPPPIVYKMEAQHYTVKAEPVKIVPVKVVEKMPEVRPIVVPTIHVEKVSPFYCFQSFIFWMTGRM